MVIDEVIVIRTVIEELSSCWQKESDRCSLVEDIVEIDFDVEERSIDGNERKFLGIKSCW